MQSRAVAIVSDPSPPDDENEVGAVLTLTWHLSAVGAVGADSEAVVLLHATESPEPATTTAITQL